MEIPKRYNPKEYEDTINQLWLENDLFHADREKGGDPYSIVIPPPNVTGILHMGHALNNTIQDILIRYRKMQGYNALWMPGTDHAGIATQNVVEKKLMKEGTSRKELGRDAFLSRVWEWKEDYGGTIIKQLKKLGASCDWQRERFTMDEGLSKSVIEVFTRLYEKDLIYRGNYIINWCPRCQTALADDEVEHHDLKGSLYYIRYPVKDSKEHVLVATTRPETMLGDVAVAVNPKDKRYAHLEGKVILLPILKRELVLIRDTYVDTEFGTGALKVTPAHDPNDYMLGLKYNLEQINVMTDDGKMNALASEEYEGMDRFECREKLVLDLQQRKLLEKIETHDHSVGHCYRCHTVIEPRLSLQWFVRMKPLAKPAIEAVKNGDISFIPQRWTKVYLNWMENIRDWCISRQIWWGHRLPVYYCGNCFKKTEDTEHHLTMSDSAKGGENVEGTIKGKGIIVSKTKPECCPDCGSTDLEQDTDVLDTWFSSWLWPFSTFNWPQQDKDLDFYYPTNTLVTAQEIIFFWVARMIMAGMEFMGKIPFNKVYIHGTVRDDSGTKMSKSLGNVIDPLDIIDEFGADALRFSIISITSQGQDVFLSKDKFEIGRNFANKLWNASRFILMNISDQDALADEIDMDQLTLDDRYIITSLNQTIQSVSASLEEFRFNDAAHTVYDFFWHHLCDRYIEAAKAKLYGEDDSEKVRVKSIIIHVLKRCLKLLHPFMPFVTEALWQIIHEKTANSLSCEKTLMGSQWPDTLLKLNDTRAVKNAEIKYELVRAGRNLRAEYSIPPSAEPKFFFKAASASMAKLVTEEKSVIEEALHCSELNFSKNVDEKAMPSSIVKAGTVYLVLEGLLDPENEIARLSKKVQKIELELERIHKKLSNESFLTKAPEKVIEEYKNKRGEYVTDQEKLLSVIAIFKNQRSNSIQ